jgi:hypothetical protein
MAMCEAGITALLERLGFSPDRLISRQENSKLLSLLGIEYSPRTAAKNAALGRDGPPYRLIAGRAMHEPRSTVQWVFNKPIRTSSYGATEIAA